MANDLSEDTIQEMSLMQILERKAHTTVETVRRMDQSRCKYWQ